MSPAEIIEGMRVTGNGSPPYLQRKMRISYKEARKICDSLDYTSICKKGKTRRNKKV